MYYFGICQFFLINFFTALKPFRASNVFPFTITFTLLFFGSIVSISMSPSIYEEFMFISIILEVILIRNKNYLPLTRETVGTHQIEEVEDDEDNIGPAMRVEYVDADNT